MQKKQTAVDWLFEQIKKDIIGIEYDYLEELQKAKEMEKEQIMNAHLEGYMDGGNHKSTTEEQYYNETYGNQF